MKTTLLVSVAVLLANTAFAASSLQHFTYSTRIPATAESCESEAQALAQKIMAADRTLTSVKGDCVIRSTFVEHGKTYKLDTLSVDYMSEAPLRLTTTMIPENTLFLMPNYPSYQACLGDLSEQAQLYTQATGLSPLSVSCEPTSDDLGVAMKIEAAGQPMSSLKTFVNETQVRFEEDNSWRDEVLLFMAKNGGTPAMVAENKIAYYASYDTSFESHGWAATDTKEQCLSQMDEANTVLAAITGKKASIVECHFDKLFNSYFLDSVYTGATTFFSDSEYSQKFMSYDECVAVRRSLISQGATQGWLGSFCSQSELSSKQYALKIITAF